jgi:UDP:flavonoid glycosyltransferase YjiC (YdhE family)
LRPAEQLEEVADALAPIREAAGLEPSPTGGTYEWLYLDPCPPSLQFTHADAIARRQPIRPTPPRASSKQSPAWLPELGAPVIYITLGTVTAAADSEFLQMAIAATSDRDLEVVVTVGPFGDPAAVGDQSANVRVERFVPQHELLAHCVGAITNGGAGSTLGALSAGVPL